MKTYEIIYCGETIDRIEACSERDALCTYLMKHPEMNDAMLWQCQYSGIWKLAEYDCEEECFIAKDAHCAWVYIAIGLKGTRHCKAVMVAVYEEYERIQEYIDPAWEKAVVELGLNKDDTNVVDWRFYGEDLIIVE